MAISKIDSNRFDKLVLDEKKTTLVKFSAPWCSYCRRISPAVDAVAKQYENIEFVEIDIDEEKAIAEKYSIEIIPTLMLFKGGNSVANVVNPESKAKIEQFLNENN